MIKIVRFLTLIMLLFSCAISAQEKNKTSDYVSFGDQMSFEKLEVTNNPFSVYEGLKTKDTINTKFTATVKAVCQVKGCWMKLNMSDEEEVMVKFKDYGFFMPTDIIGREVVVNGNAYVEEMSVANQQHFAKDAGKTDAEVAKINKIKKTYSFVADGVLLKK